jgi:hypothetical protein
MAAAATFTTLFTFRDALGVLRRRIRVDVTALANGANVIPHGIVKPESPASGAVPLEEVANPTSVVVLHRTSAADGTNLNYTVDSGAGTTASIYVTV